MRTNGGTDGPAGTKERRADPALRVLLVGQADAEAEAVAAVLQRAGWQVSVSRVGSADEMQEALATPWDVVIADWNQPFFCAPAAIDSLRAGGLETPLIVVSDALDDDSCIAVLRAGAYDFVLRDQLARLNVSVERALHLYESQRAERWAVAALKASEMRYRLIVENTNQGVLVTDPTGVITFSNAHLARMLGFATGALVGRSCAELLDDAGVILMRETLAGFAIGTTYSPFDLKLRRKDGSWVDVVVESNPMIDDAGQFQGAFAMVSDVTERIRAAAALRLSEARFRCLWESDILLITVVGRFGRIVDVNQGFTRRLGYTRDELINGDFSWADLTPPGWEESDAKARAELVGTGAASPWEKAVTKKNGEHLPVLASAFMLDDDVGVAIILATDLTERKKVDKALQDRIRVATVTVDISMALTQHREQEAMMQRCAEAIVSGLDAVSARIWTLDRSETRLVLEGQAGLHRPGLETTIPASLLAALTQVTDPPREMSDLIRVPLPEDGAWMAANWWAGYALYPLTIGGRIVGGLSIFTRGQMTDEVVDGLRAAADAIALGVERLRSERVTQSLESQLRQSQKLEAVGSLAGGIAHDFNNMLSVIVGYAELVLDDLGPDHPSREDVAEIEQAALRASDLTRQLLAFSRQQMLKPRILDLNVVLNELISMLRRLLPEDIELLVSTDKAIGNVSADPGQLEQVLLNLVVNARDAIHVQGKVVIATAEVTLDECFVGMHEGATAGRHVMLSVSDSGSGISEEVRARIFEPFFTTKPTGKGTGLGLSTVFGIVTQSGGIIDVESEVGKGSTFKVYLPVVDCPLPDLDTVRPPGPVHGNETILLCEDEASVRTLVTQILTRLGYRVLEARSGDEAMTLSDKVSGIDLLLTDVVMPLLSGREVAERLRVRRPELKVLYMSGYTDDAILRHGLSEDGLSFIQKPIRTAALAHKVREVLDAGSPSEDSPIGTCETSAVYDAEEEDRPSSTDVW